MARRTEIPPGEVITIAMAGNPNVGKSTLFNAVTGLNQHTGNWPGKTVASAEGLCRHGGKAYRLVDLPGTYSLLAHSAEEEVARNFLCFSRPEAVCIVCDATCLERNLNLVLQTLEITPRAAICLNLMDEAKKRKLRVEPARLEALLGVPLWLHDALILGVYRVAAWVVSVMLPPMAIFFPLFTLLEDMGYLPRVAYNLDRPLKRCGACGKQALTICMGFGCNAAGVVGCRIIDSPRERLLAILTNSFVPCNGRFPTLVNLILLFFVGTAAGPGQSVLSALLLTGFILLGAAATFAVTGLLSRTVLRGVPSSFTLELPPYRRPQWGQVIVRSVFDRTLFVLARAVKAAAPAGLLLWLMANLTIGGSTILAHCAGFLEPAGRALGMDGVILLAFLLGLPANEIVVPIMLMGYLSQGVLQQPEGLAQMQGVFLANGWTPVTALCVMLFMLMHWPCATTLMTIRKETGSLKWTLLAAALPTLCGTLACLLVNGLYRLVT